MGINNSLRQGKIGEGYLTSRLQELGFNCELAPNGRFPDWDIKVDYVHRNDVQPITFECKFDIYQAKSGNIAIETFNTNSAKPSGISATKADFWAHILATSPAQIWLIKVNELKSLMEKVKGRELSNVGDGNAAIVLYPDTILSEYFFPLHSATEEECLKFFSISV